MDKEQEFNIEIFNIEIEKLSAINKINLEIYNRLDPFKYKNDYKYSILNKITLKDNILCFNFDSENIKSKTFQEFFQNIPNFFNDLLPNTEYFDMENIILKYSMLNPKKL